MRTRLIRLRFRRRLRKGQRQVEGLGSQAEEHIDQHLLGRFDRLNPVRRFVAGWVGLMLLIIAALVAQNIALSNHYQTLKPIPGGIYNEGVLGHFTNANPIYATTDVDASVSRLIFSGLLTYNSSGGLMGDLASDFSVDPAHNNIYTVHLKPNLKWQDGQPLTSADVVYTYQLIQNPDVKSPLQNAWQGIEISAPDAKTVIFKLPGTLAPFPYSLTTGIVPKHILDTIKPADMRTADFNTIKPIGAGPFAWQAIEVGGNGDPKHSQEKIALTPFADYALGQAKLQKFVVQAYADKDELISAIDSNQLTGAEGLTELPAKLRGNHIIQNNLTLLAANMVFFKNTSGPLSDTVVRKAIVQSSNVPEIMHGLDYQTRQVREPILIGQTAYDKSLVQAGHDLKAANTALDAAGWLKDPSHDGKRTKAGQPLSFTLTAANTPEYHKVTDKLKQQWQQAGINANIQFLDSNDFQNALANHSYEAILYGISIGHDPDVFVYWDSSQADIRSANRLNLSEYKNPTADAALESGRTRLDPTLRTIKYKPFLQVWQQDNAALGLYQPRVLYITNVRLSGLTEAPINTATDRFINVHNWQIREAKVTN